MTINEYLAAEHAAYAKAHPSYQSRLARIVKCADGLTISVQASDGHYCDPRENVGPWRTVEIGYPSEVVAEILPWVEDPENPTDTVYGWVPVDVVDAVIAAHGGFA